MRDFYTAHCEQYGQLKTHITCINCTLSSRLVGKTWQSLDFSGALSVTNSVTCYGLSEHCGSAIAFSEFYTLLASSVFIKIKFRSIPPRPRHAVLQYGKCNQWKGPHNDTSIIKVFQKVLQNCQLPCPILKQTDQGGLAV